MMQELISRQAAIELVRDVCDAIMSGCESWYDPEIENEVYKDTREVDAILKCKKEVRIALRNMPSAQPVARDTNVLSNDTISRQAAIDELKKTIAVNKNPHHDARIWEEGMNCAVTIIGALPSAQPERTGKWIHGRELAREMISDCIVAIRYDGWRCSECDCLVEQEREPLYKFCPNCGARME